MRALILVVVLLGAPAHAGTSMFTLEWNAPAECPSGGEVTEEVSKRLGGRTSETPVAAKASVTRLADATWQVVLSTDQAGTVGERTLAGPTCAAVASATALILALTIDPNALAPPPMASPPAAIRPPKPIPLVSGRSRLYVRASPVVGASVAANVVSGGAALAFGVLARRLSVELTSHVFFPESHDSAVAGAGGTFWLLAVGGSVCGALVDAAAVRMGGCGGFEVQGMHGEGYGVTQPRTAVAGWGAPTASVFIDVKLASWLWLAAHLSGVVPLSHPSFVLDGVGPVFRVSPVSARASLGVEVRF